MAGCSTSSAASYENCGAPPQGLYGYPGPFQGIDSQYALVSARNKPPGAPADFALVCEACLRARGLIYFKTTPGDCPKPSAVPGIGGGQVIGLSGTAASGVVGGLGAAGVLAGPATLGISAAVSVAVAGLTDLFQHHSIAVQTEQSTICAVAGYFNPLVKQLDAAVASGQITDQEGISYMIDICNQAISGLASIVKSCNASCVYTGILKAHKDFASTYYPALSPSSSLMPQAPGMAPVTFNNTPGGVPDAGSVAPIRASSDPNFAYLPAIVPSAAPLAPNSVLPSGCSMCSDYLNNGYNQQTGQSGQAADVPPSTPINWTMWGAIAAIVALFIVLLRPTARATA